LEENAKIVKEPLKREVLLKIFEKKPLLSSNVVLTHYSSAIYYNGLKPHWRKMQKLSKNH